VDQTWIPYIDDSFKIITHLEMAKVEIYVKYAKVRKMENLKM